LASLAFISCEKPPTISGKPLNYWIERLNDVDAHTRLDALLKINMCTGDQLKGVKSKLIDAANRNNECTEAAVITLARKLHHFDIKWLVYYYSDPSLIQEMQSIPPSEKRAFIRDLRKLKATNKGNDSLFAGRILEWIDPQPSH
jgi:hypothetical protein